MDSRPIVPHLDIHEITDQYSTLFKFRSVGLKS